MTADAIDLIVEPRWIVPVEPPGAIYEDHALAVDHGRILELLPRAEAARKYRAAERIERPSHILIPGLINAHTHGPMSLLRGIADDKPLMEWLHKHIWPLESRWVGPDFVKDGAELAVAEMVRCGTTCFADMYYFPDIVARTAAHLGLRARIGLIVLEAPSPWAKDAADYVHRGLAVHDEFKAHPLIDTMFAPHAPYSVSDHALDEVRKFSDQLQIPIQIHVHETRAEVQDALGQHGQRPFERLYERGLLSPLLMAVHMTQLLDEEIARAAETGAHVIHCPESNLKLASGFCPVSRLLESGVNVALGTDGAASNNDLDMLGEMRTAALLAKGVSGDARSVDANTVLRMATLNGAAALGLDQDTGSLSAGKWADLTCFDLSDISTQPVYDPVSTLVYAATRQQVSDVWVAGRALLSDGRLTQIDEQALVAKVSEWQTRLGGEA